MTNKAKQQIGAALMAPESDVPEPQRTRSSSFSAQVKDLGLGETAVRAERMGATLPAGKAIEALNEVKARLRDSVSPLVSKLRAGGEVDYLVETADTLTATSIVAMVIVTRVK